MSKLFEPYQLGNITLKNRVVMAPLTRSRAVENNTANDLMATYYEQRSEAGLIITEGTSPSPNGTGYPRIPGIYSQAHIDGWKKVTTAVHEAGSKIFLQLMHTGRISHIDNLPEGGVVVGPSPEQAGGEMYTDQNGPQPHTTPKEMSHADIESTIEEYVQAAKNAIEAGFDGVEIHGANGYLIEQFLNPNVNKRSDEYGGSAENRARFLVEIAKRTVAAIGKERTGLRLSPYGVFNETGAFEGIEDDYAYIAGEIGKIGLLYIHIVDHSAMGAPEVPQSVKDRIKKAFGSNIILSGGYDKARAEKDLEANLGELVAFGRPFIANPDLVTHFKEDAELAQPDPNTFYTPGAEGYTDYPTLAEKQEVSA